MDTNLLFFPALVELTKAYLLGKFKGNNLPAKNNLKNSKSDISKAIDSVLVNKTRFSKNTIESKIIASIEHVKSPNNEAISRNQLSRENNSLMPKTNNHNGIFYEAKSKFKNLYGNFVSYVRSKYKSKVKNKKKLDPDCWQIGIDFSRICNFIFFPKKMKKTSGILIDKGIMLDYINPSPALCNY